MRARALLSGLLLTGASFFVLAGLNAVPASAETKVSHNAEECIKKLEAGGEPNDCQQAPSPILPAKDEIIFGGLAFVILFVLMAKVAYPGIQKGMEDRSNRIRQNLDDAERVRAEAQGVLEEYQRQVGDARTESARIIDEARQTAEQLRRDLMTRAEAEAADVRTRSQEDVTAAQQRAVADLRGQVATLAIDLAEKVVERNLDRDTNIALINSYIDQVGAQS